MSARAVKIPPVVAGLAGAAAMIAVVTLAARVVGFGRWFVFSASVGSTCVGTAYSSANLVPNVLFEVVAGGALAATVVPLLAGPLVRGERAEADRTASALLTWAVLVLVPLALVLALLAGPIARLLVPNDCAGQAALAARMLVVFAPQVVLYGVGIVLAGVLQAHRRFIAPALAPLLSSVVVVAAYVAYRRLADGRQGTGWTPGRGTELVLSLGTTAGVAMLSLPLLLAAHRAGVRLRPTLRLAPGVGIQARRLALAGLAGLLAQQAVVVVTLLLTNRAGGSGTINVYQYVQAVYLLPYAVLAVPLATAAFPQLAERAAAGDAPGFTATLARSTRLVVLAAAAGAAVLAAVAPAVGGVFSAVDASRQGGPGAVALDGFAASLTAFAPGLLGLALVAHLGRALFAAGHARWAAGATAGGWLLAGVLSVVLVSLTASGDRNPRATLLALGVASSIGMTAAGIALLVGAARVRVAGDGVDGRTSYGALPGLVGTLAAAVAVGLVAAVLGRLATDALLALEPLGDSGVGALLAGTVGGLVAGLVLAAGWGFSADLRALLRRAPVVQVSTDGEPTDGESTDGQSPVAAVRNPQ